MQDIVKSKLSCTSAIRKFNLYHFLQVKLSCNPSNLADLSSSPHQLIQHISTNPTGYEIQRLLVTVSWIKWNLWYSGGSAFTV